LREYLVGGSYLPFGRRSLADYGINVFLQYADCTYALYENEGNALAVNLIIRSGFPR
jgi:hypothetical protein